MKNAIYLTREPDGEFISILCNDYRELPKEYVRRTIWHQFFEEEVMEKIKNSDNISTRTGLEMAMEIYRNNKDMLPAMFITQDELQSINKSNEKNV